MHKVISYHEYSNYSIELQAGNSFKRVPIIDLMHIEAHKKCCHCNHSLNQKDGITKTIQRFERHQFGILCVVYFHRREVFMLSLFIHDTAHI